MSSSIVLNLNVFSEEFGGFGGLYLFFFITIVLTKLLLWIFSLHHLRTVPEKWTEHINLGQLHIIPRLVVGQFF